MVYLTFSEYASYGGTITSEATFNQYEFKARKLIDSLTARRVEYHMAVISEAVKRCMFELIKLEEIYQNGVAGIKSSGTGGGGSGLMMASFTNDGYSETYATGAKSVGEYIDSLRKYIDDAEKEVVKDYLAYEYDDRHIKLLYRGVYDNAPV